MLVHCADDTRYSPFLESHKDHPETRTRLSAWKELRGLGIEVPEELRRKVLGVVLEVGVNGGMDYLAAYEDHSARYYNFSGKVVLLEADDKELGDMIDRLLEAGQTATMRLGLWESERRRGVAVNRQYLKRGWQYEQKFF